jgi:hypothetical protein
MTNETEKLKEIINKSGYPLQLALEYQINSTEREHNFRVLSSEHRWVDKDSSSDGYIDLMAYHRNYNIRIVIECKRIIGNWNFLISEMNPSPTGKIKVLSISDEVSDNIKKIKWVQLSMYPESFVSSFCVFESNNQKDERTLEKFAGDLLLSIESLAKEEILYKNKFNSKSDLFYIPMIVTTAKIQLSNFNPGNINLDDGKIATSNIKEQDNIRFTKSLASNLNYTNEIMDIKEADKSNARTVIVVQAIKLIEFLKHIDI